MTAEWIRQFGIPGDANGWRQFLIERPCPSNPRPLRQAVLPCIVWVRSKPELCPHCGGQAFRVLPSSARAIAKASGVPLTIPDPNHTVCVQEGDFIE